jgi:hypothetical protein
MHFKTIEGARKRAAFENADAKWNKRPWRFRVVPNENSHQVAQGFLWRIKKEKAK